MARENQIKSMFMSHIIHLTTNKATERLCEIKRQHLNSIGYDAMLKEQYMAQLGKTKQFRQGGLKKKYQSTQLMPKLQFLSHIALVQLLEQVPHRRSLSIPYLMTVISRGADVEEKEKKKNLNSATRQEALGSINTI